MIVVTELPENEIIIQRVGIDPHPLNFCMAAIATRISIARFNLWVDRCQITGSNGDRSIICFNGFGIFAQLL